LSAACRLALRPSPALAGAIVVAHGAAAAAAGFLMKDVWGAALAVALLALGGVTAWRRALLRGGGAVRVIELAADQVRLRLGSGEEVAVTVAPRRYVSRLLVTLGLGAPAFHPYGGHTLLVSADMLERADFRRLRIWALWGRLPDVAAEQLAG
jgi:hypothetical protein